MSMENRMSPAPDVSGATAGAAAIASANPVVDELFGDAAPADAAPDRQEPAKPAQQVRQAPAKPAQPARQAPAQPADRPEDEPQDTPPAELSDFNEPPENVLPGKPGEETVPDHVVRKGQKSIETWKQLRAELEAAEQKASEVERDRLLKEQQIEELNKKLETAPPEDKIKEMERRIAEQEDIIGRMDISRSKAFQEQFDKPINEVFGKVVRTFVKAGHSQEESVDLARKVFRPGMEDVAKLEQVLGDESAVTIGAVATLLEDREAHARLRDEALVNWRQTREASELEERRKSASEVGAILTRASDAALEAVIKDGSWLFKPGQDPQWNAGVEARKNAAIGYIRGGNPETLARLVFEGIASPAYRKGYEQVKARLDELQSKYDALVSGGRPGLMQRAPAPGEAPRQSEEAPKTVGEFVDATWNDE